jgi:hypothetical protein
VAQPETRPRRRANVDMSEAPKRGIFESCACELHAVVETNGLSVRLALTAGGAHDNRLAGSLLSRLKKCCLRIEAITPIGSSLQSGALGPTYRREATAKILFSPHLYRARNWANASSIRSNNVGGSRRATKSSRPTTLPSSSSPQYGCGCESMPNQVIEAQRSASRGPVYFAGATSLACVPSTLVVSPCLLASFRSL